MGLLVSLFTLTGSTISVIMDLSDILSITVSAVVAVVYTFLGGLRSVAYTDIVQLVCIAVGLAIACPFAVRNAAVDFSKLGSSWVGQVPTDQVGIFVDLFAVVALGGIPWQVYFQRILACSTTDFARLSSCVAAVMCALFAVPPALMGLGRSRHRSVRVTDWNSTSYLGEVPIPAEKMSLMLPLTLRYLCPRPVAIVGIGTLAAAVMSSADSSILSSATVFTNNIYRNALRSQASDRELVWVLRVAILVVGVISTGIAIVARSVYGLYVMCSDLMYVILFPQFTCVLFLPGTNSYGGLAGFVISLLLRLFGGESLIGLPAVLKFPLYSEQHGQRFPFRTVAMLCNLLAIVLGSKLTHVAFNRGWLSPSLDILHSFPHPLHPHSTRPWR
ncbi:high affinity choline transporter 1-like [Pomacea canaliculata]|uniref:high affinity choline transporter 1-like n=1 Tax=Pomacea canaliculata TaxID=400727 RepID=UPI000D734ABB|nr:high affinity choline transporter 1-like [Pomacea canaliculata]XP_025106328.1 high affinity choline transporter 1-like [Pomacea canaliculata]